MLIKVTQEHINKGVALNCQKCPIALAIVDSNPKITAADISGDEAIIYPDNGIASCRELPPAAKQFVYDFDVKNPVKPFEFELLFNLA